MNSTIFIEASKLGVLEEQIKHAAMGLEVKRNRQREFARLSRILHDLKLVPSEMRITGLAFGLRSDGVPGLFALAEKRNVVARLPQEHDFGRYCGKHINDGICCGLLAMHPGECRP